MPKELSRALLLLLAAVVVVAAFATTMQGETRQESALKRVTFTFTPHRSYGHVYLAGTFNGWRADATPMHRTSQGYEVVVPLAPGEYQYKFVADGEWITDEKAKAFKPDGYGGRNSVVNVDETFEPLDMARGDGRILVDGLTHRMDAWERSLDVNGNVTLRTRAWTGDVDGVALFWKATNTGSTARTETAGSGPYGDTMSLFDTDGTYDYYSYTLHSPSFEYVFVFRDGDKRVMLDADGVTELAATSSESAPVSPLSDASPFTFDAGVAVVFSTPDWVKDGIFYQIFPERFANGDPDNDQDFSEWYYEGLTELPSSGKTNFEFFHFVDDWYDVSGLSVSPYRTDGKPDWNSFYGGDIEGVRSHLDYLQDLGVTIIYFNPLFEAKSNHKYDAATYMKIDPHFGTNDEFARFVSECHDRGIRVVMDLAINHTGHTYWAFVDARLNGSESPYWDWYEWKKWPVPGTKVTTPANASDYYDCWWGFGQMPNLNFDLSRPGPDEQNVVDIKDAEPNWPVVNHLLDVATTWLTDAHVDGFRLDVAGEIPQWFWKLFRERVRKTNPDAYIVGELWGSSPEWVNGNCFDAVMNYKYFRDPVFSFIVRNECDAAAFDRQLAPGRFIYPEQGVRAMMNLVGSHDTERFLTAAGGDTGRLRLATLFQMTYVGAPSIYYGDEIGMSGGHDPDCRRPFLWNWTEDPSRVATHDYVRELAALRKEHPCFTEGSFNTLLADGDVLVFARRAGPDAAVVVLNAGGKEATVTIPLGDRFLGGDGPASAGDHFGILKSQLTGTDVPVDRVAGESSFTVTVPAVTGDVFMPVPETR